MKNVYLASVGGRSGKSVISLGLAMNCPGKAGFYKPFRESLVKVNGETMDEDAFLMAEALGLGEGKKLSPFVYDPFEPTSLEEIVAGYNELCKGKEFMIIEGGKDVAGGFAHNTSHADIAKALKAPIVLVATPSSHSVDAVFMFRELCEKKGADLMGVILNRSSGSRERKFIEDHGIRVIGEVPAMPELRTFRVSELLEKTDAKAIAGEKGMDNIVETMLVGAMSNQTAMGYMCRSCRKAVITGGDRTEILLSALSTDTACIVITGGIRPSQMVLSKANELNVPVLMTSEDTVRVTETIDHLIVRIDPRDKEKTELIKNSVRSGVDIDSVWRS